MKYFKAAIIIFFILEIGLFLYAETAVVMVSRQDIKDNELARPLQGVTVVHISDLHIRKPGLRTNKLVKIINKIDPQIVFITGDFLSGNQGIKPCIDTISQFAKGRFVVAVLGNGDHSFKRKYIDTELLVNGLKSAGVEVLQNETLLLKIKQIDSKEQKNVYIVGIDDNYLMYDDIFKAMNSVPAAAPKILLAHSPNIIDRVDSTGINLILSGHTHGGQIDLPFIGAVYLNQPRDAKRKLVAGLYNYETKLFVNKGIGTAEIPLRLFCRPEVTVLNFIKT